MARTAVVVGTANRVSRRQSQRWAAQDQAAAAPAAPPPPPAPAPVAAPAPAAAPAEDVYAQLTKLAGLRDAGILTEDEFAAKKSQLLGI
jgi:hypothetical protein